MLRNRAQGDPSASVLVLADCGAGVLKRLENSGRSISVSAGQVVAREGDSSGTVCVIIIEGIADVVIGGRRVTTLGRGDTFVEMPRVEGTPRSASIIARQRTRLFELDAQGLIDVLPLFPALSRHMLRDLAARIRSRERVRDVDSEFPALA